MAIHSTAYDVILPFGKYKDHSIGYVYDVDAGYLTSLATMAGIPVSWRTTIQTLLRNEPVVVNAPATRLLATGKVYLAIVTKRRIAVKFSHNPANKADVERLDRFKAQIDGRAWDGENFWWTVPLPQLPRLVEFFGKENIEADADVKEAYRNEILRRRELDAIREKTDSDIEIPTLIPLFPYQKVAVEFAERANGRALVADQMGLGKTATAIGFAVYKQAKTLVICPKSVKPGWMREIMAFAGQTACVWRGNGFSGDVSAQFHIINYDIVEKHAERLRELGFDLLVCDEATYLKNYKSIRAKVILGFWTERKKYPGFKTKWVLFLTGTPILNRPTEAFTLLSAIDKDRFNNPKLFLDRYSADRDGNPSPHLRELFERTRDVVIRRLKKHVATELPEKQRFDLLVELDDKEQKQYKKELVELLRKWKLSGKPSAAHMPPIRNILFEFKWPRILEFVDQMIDSGRPILVFVIQQEHAYRLKRHYGDRCGVITGNESESERDKVVQDAKAKKIDVVVFTIIAGGMGIDGLQHVIDAVLFVDFWWVPSIHEQAEDRVHRKGQTGQVQIWYMQCVQTFDEILRTIVAEKQKVIDLTVDGVETDTVREQNVFDELISRMGWTLAE